MLFLLNFRFKAVNYNSFVVVESHEMALRKKLICLVICVSLCAHLYQYCMWVVLCGSIYKRCVCMLVVCIYCLPVAQTTPPAPLDIGSIVWGVIGVITTIGGIFVITTICKYKRCGRSWQVNDTTTGPGGHHGDYSTAGLKDTTQVSGRNCSCACVPLVIVGCGYWVWLMQMTMGCGYWVWL